MTARLLTYGVYRYNNIYVAEEQKLRVTAAIIVSVLGVIPPQRPSVQPCRERLTAPIAFFHP